MTKCVCNYEMYIARKWQNKILNVHITKKNRNAYAF